LPTVVGVAVAAAILFQLFGRYSYTYYHGLAIDRVDRVTGTVCRLPCEAPTATPAPAETPSLELEDQRAIELVKQRPDAQRLETEIEHHPISEGDRYLWAVVGRYSNEGQWGGPGESPDFDPSFQQLLRASPESEWTPPPGSYPVRVVWCVSDDSGGVEWEVHLDTGEVFPVMGNAALEAKYSRIRKASPTP